jgi:Mn2+/Fe2+ NRAMP family transporter
VMGLLVNKAGTTAAAWAVAAVIIALNTFLLVQTFGL